jgi:hypothetical protein
MTRKRLPGPAIVIALLALFVALSGTAVAAGVVPLAKRALVADNAKKLNGVTLKGVVGGIAAAAPALVSVKTQPWSLNAGGTNDFSLACPSGAKAIAGGFDATSGTALALDTRPSSDQTAWKIFLGNASDSDGASGTLYAVCLA